MQITLEQWNVMLPGSERYPFNFRSVLPWLLASLCYHRDWLRKNLPAGHSLFSSPVFTQGHVDRLASSLMSPLGLGRCEATGLQATGIPSHLSITGRLSTLERKMDESTQQLPERLKDSLLKNFQVNGALPITQEAFQLFTEKIHSEIRQLLRAREQKEEGEGEWEGEKAAQQNQSGRIKWGTWSWRKASSSQVTINPVPAHFLLPRTHISGLWLLWHFGNHSADYDMPIRPYRLLNGGDLPQKDGSQQLCRLRSVMGVIEWLGRRMARWSMSPHLPSQDTPVSALTKARALELFQDGYLELLEKIEPGTKSKGGRGAEREINTLYNFVRRHMTSQQQQSSGSRAAEGKKKQGRKRKCDSQGIGLLAAAAVAGEGAGAGAGAGQEEMQQ